MQMLGKPGIGSPVSKQRGVGGPLGRDGSPKQLISGCRRTLYGLTMLVEPQSSFAHRMQQRVPPAAPTRAGESCCLREAVALPFLAGCSQLCVTG